MFFSLYCGHFAIDLGTIQSSESPGAGAGMPFNSENGPLKEKYPYMNHPWYALECDFYIYIDYLEDQCEIQRENMLLKKNPLTKNAGDNTEKRKSKPKQHRTDLLISFNATILTMNTETLSREILYRRIPQLLHSFPLLDTWNSIVKHVQSSATCIINEFPFIALLTWIESETNSETVSVQLETELILLETQRDLLKDMKESLIMADSDLSAPIQEDVAGNNPRKKGPLLSVLDSDECFKWRKNLKLTYMLHSFFVKLLKCHSLDAKPSTETVYLIGNSHLCINLLKKRPLIFWNDYISIYFTLLQYLVHFQFYIV